MPQRIVSNSFVSGEISPELYGRHDLKAYFNGAALLENFIVRRTGGIRKRSGTDVLYEFDGAESPDDGTLDNKFRPFPYFYDADTFGLLVFRLTSAGVVQSKLIIREAETNTVGEWSSPGVNTGITTSAELNDLKCKQVGDTLFFTRLGYQSFACKITMAECLSEFRMLDNAITVQPPAEITATPKNFYKDGEGGARGIQKHYALYGVKDGVMSKPATVSTAASTSTVAGTCTPWTAGATVKVAGTLDFSAHDYYILAKKTGMNYGKISEIYPVEQIKAVASTNVSNDLAFRGTVAGFNDSAPKFLNGDPALLSSSKPTIKLTRKCMALKATATTVGATTTYRVVTPHYLIAFGTASTKYVSVSCRPDAVRLDTMVASQVNMAGVAATFTPFEYEDAGSTISVGAPIAKTADSNGNFYGINVGSRAGNKRFGFIIEWTAATKTTDCLFIGGVTASLSSTPISTSTFFPCTDAILACPEAIYTGDNAANEPVAATLVSEPTVFGKYKLGTPSADVIHCTLWNEHTPIQSYCLAWDTWSAATLRTQVDMLLGADFVFHVNGSSMSEIVFTVPENEKRISSIIFHLGNHAVAWADGARVAMPASSYVTATLYAVDGATEVKVEEFNVNVGFIESHKVAVTFPDDVPPTTTYRLAFSEAVRMRGVTINSINTTLEFVDDNVIPGAITGQQDMLVVGDSNMDCALFDVYEQRAVFASSANLPFSLWFSAAGDLYNFYALRPQADDDAFTVTIPAKRASQIRHILATKELMLFTEDGVYVCDAESGTGFSYRSIRMKKTCNAAASTAVEPIQIDGKTIFVGEDGRTVFELKYDLMEDAIRPSDRSVLAYHLTESAQISKIAFQRYPDSIVWFLLDDGTLLSMTYMPEHEVYAWSHHAVPAPEAGMKIVDLMEIGSIVTGDGVETTSDVLLVYESTTGGAKTIVERLRPNACADVVASGDSGHHLCIDHVGGDNPAAVSAKLVTLRPESPEINTQGIPKRVVDVCLRLRRSGMVQVNPYQPTIPAVAASKAVVDDATDTTALFSGDVKIMPRGYINGDGQLQIESTDNLPCEILSAVYTMDFP
jgi:hypothetical protein